MARFPVTVDPSSPRETGTPTYVLEGTVAQAADGTGPVRRPDSERPSCAVTVWHCSTGQVAGVDISGLTIVGAGRRDPGPARRILFLDEDAEPEQVGAILDLGWGRLPASVSRADLLWSRLRSREEPMPRIARLLTLSIGATALLIVPTTLTNRAQGDSGCNAAGLSGPYGINGNGFIVGAPAAFAGTLVFDGQDKSSGSAMVNIGGEVDRIDVTGKYKVNPGCAGTMTIFTTHHKPPTEHYHDVYFVVVDGGREMLFMEGGTYGSESDRPAPSVTFSGVMKRLA